MEAVPDQRVFFLNKEHLTWLSHSKEDGLSHCQSCFESASTLSEQGASYLA